MDIAKRTGAPVVAIVELANEISEDLGGDHQVFDPNLGGTVKFDWGWVKLVPAWHTSTTPKGTVNTPAGLLIGIGDKTDLPPRRHRPVRRPRADRATAGNPSTWRSCASAATTRWTASTPCVAAKLVGAKQVIPCHYDTFPPIETDAQAFKSDVESAGYGEVVVLDPGEVHSL